MNELAKLLSSVLLLGAGFCAASLVGPPEAVMRLAHYLQPDGVPSADGLRPLPADAPPVDFAGWPAGPPAASLTSPAEGSPANVAGVTAMLPPSSWDAPPTGAAAPRDFAASPWDPPLETERIASRELASPTLDPGSPAAQLSAAPPTEDWLTGATLADAPAQAEAPERPLTPVPRRGEPLGQTVADEVATTTEPGWPDLGAPPSPPLMPPALEGPSFGALPSGGPALGGPREVTYAKPASNEAAYSMRPRFEEGAFADPSNPLRATTHEPLARAQERQPFVQHVVTDGDTLPLLAERYLGDASRAQELFELNRDRLEHPDLLPIGMVLKAPKGGARRTDAAEPTGTSLAPPASPYATGFTTVSANGPATPTADLGSVAVRPLTPIGTEVEPPLSEAQRLGPVDPRYDAEATWDANRW